MSAVLFGDPLPSTNQRCIDIHALFGWFRSLQIFIDDALPAIPNARMNFPFAKEFDRRPVVLQAIGEIIKEPCCSRLPSRLQFGSPSRQ